MMPYSSHTLSKPRKYLRRAWCFPFWASLAVCGIAVNLTNVKGANAAETIILRHVSVSKNIDIPFSELETLAKGGKPSSRLTKFLGQTALTPEEMATLLDASIPDTRIPLGKTDIQFLLFELNKLVGDPLDREDLQPLATSLRSAYLDKNISFLELLRRYPKDTVGLNVSKLSQVYQDVDLFVQRISPLFNFLEDLLPDLVCDCQLATDEMTPDFSKLERSTELSRELLRGRRRFTPQKNGADYRFKVSMMLEELALMASQSSRLSLFSGAAGSRSKGGIDGAISQGQQIAIAAQSPPQSSFARKSEIRKTSQVSRKVVFAFGPVSRSFTIENLNRFAVTGKMPQQWKSYLKLAQIQPEEFRRLLIDQKPVNFLEIDNFLNSFLGEYALFQLGQLVYTPSQRANVQALRSSVTLSAADDEQISWLEILQNYPAQHLTIDAKKMLRLTKNLKGKGAVKFATANLQDVLIAAQMAIAEEVCDCIQPETNEARHLDNTRQTRQMEQVWAQPPCH